MNLAATALGVEALADLLTLWGRIPQAGQQAQIDQWLEDAVELIMGRYSLSAQIAVAYYRLVRALATGSTLEDIDTPEPGTITLQKLRVEFTDLVDPWLTPEARGEVAVAGSTEKPSIGGDQLPIITDGGSKDITVEESGNWKRDRDAAREAAREEAFTVVEALGPKLRDKKVAQANKDWQAKTDRANKPDSVATAPTLDDLDMERTEAQAQAGYRMAAAGERITQNGARSTTWTAQQNDKRVIGYVRVSRTGTPCGWCAMLISRGLVLYKSKTTASVTEDGDKYHDNCHCYAVPVWSKEDYETNPLYAANREYSALWPKVTGGDPLKPTDTALTKWRRYFRNRNAAAA